MRHMEKEKGVVSAIKVLIRALFRLKLLRRINSTIVCDRDGSATQHSLEVLSALNVQIHAHFQLTIL